MSSRLTSRVRFSHVLSATLLALLCLSVLANYLLRDVGPDEGMYLGASRLAMDRDIYSDFSFFQTPFLPLVLSRVLRVVGGSHPILWARLFTFAHHAALLLLLFWIVLWYTSELGYATLFTVMVGLNRVLYEGASSLHNVTFANLFSVLGFFAIVRAHRADRPRPALAGLAGFSVAIAVGFKLTYLPVLVSFAAAVGLSSAVTRSASVVRALLLPFTAGMIAGLLPIAAIAWDRFDVFRFNNITWHSYLIGIALDGSGGRWGLYQRILRELHFFVNCMKCLGVLAIVVPSTVLLALSTLRANRKSLREILCFDRLLPIVVLFAAVSQFFFYAHVPYWYLGPIVLFSALIVPTVYPILDPRSKGVAKAMLAVATGYLVLVQLPVIDNGVRALDSRRWLPMQYSDVATGLALDPPEGEVTVLGNPAILYAAEAKLRFDAMSATSAFTRLSSLMEPLNVEASRRYHVATYREVRRSVERGEVDALIVSWVFLSSTPDALSSSPGPCGTGRDGFRAVVEALCEATFEAEIHGRGNGTVVVFRRGGGRELTSSRGDGLEVSVR